MNNNFYGIERKTEETDFEFCLRCCLAKQNKELAAVNNKRLPTKNTNKQNLPTKNPSPVKSGNSSLDVIKQHGYETINGATIKNNLISYLNYQHK